MPQTITTTAGTFQIPDYTDPGDVVQWLLVLVRRLGNDLLPNLGVGVLTGKLADRPTTFTGKRFYVVLGETDAALIRNNGRLFYDTGAAWQELGLKVAAGPLADRPTTFVGHRFYIVLGDATASNNGLLFWDTGSAWQQIGGGGFVRVTATAVGDVPARLTLAASATGDALQVQDSSGNNLFRLTAAGRPVQPVVAVAYTYNSDGSVATMTEKIGTVTVRTLTITYNADGTVASTSDVHDGVTDAATYAYTTSNGQSVPSTITRTRTVN